MEFSKILKEQRTAKQLSQEQLADRLHIARQSISKWERGEAYPSIGMLLQLSELFDISVDELLKGDDHLKKEIVKGGEKVKYPRWVSFFEWVFLTGVLVLFTRITFALLAHFEVVDLEVALFRGWIAMLLPAALMITGAIGAEEMSKKKQR